MKRLSSIILLALFGLAASAFAQTQQGYVKTKGRMMNGKYTAGKRISDATVQVKDRSAVKSRTDGTFSFPVSGKSYSLQQVQKQGYELLDQDVLYKQYSYSSNPLEIVMEDKAQLEADRRALERQVRRITDEELRRRGEEIEALKEQNNISEEKYRELLNKLNNDYDLNEKLIKDMVEQYNKIDFDQHDEFNRRVSDCIINGRLDEADSLLHTKGDVNKLIDQLNKHHVANEQARVTLSQSEAAEEHERQEIAQICYNKFLIFKMQHLNDSAAELIIKRAELDTTNVLWQIDAGKFISDYLAQYTFAEKFFYRALCSLRMNKTIDKKVEALCLNELGTLYEAFMNGKDGFNYIRKALQIREKINDVSELQTSYNNLGQLFEKKELFDSSRFYYIKSLEIGKKTNNIIGIARTYNYLGSLYETLGQYDTALVYFNRALNIFDQQSNDYAVVCNNIGHTLSKLSQEDSALLYFEKSHIIWKELYGEKHPKVALAYNNIGGIYSSLGKDSKALSYYKKCLEIQKDIYGSKSDPVSRSYMNIGALFAKKKQNKQALKYSLQAVEIYNELHPEEDQHIAQLYHNIGEIYADSRMGEEALNYLNKALEIRRKKLGEDHDKTAEEYSSIAMVYAKSGKHDTAIYLYEKSINIIRTILGKDSKQLITPLYNLSYSYRMEGKFDKMHECCDQAIDVSRRVYGENSKITAQLYQLKSSSYLIQKDIANSIIYLKKGIQCVELSDAPDTAFIAQLTNNLASVYYQNKMYDSALVYCTKSHEYYKTIMGENNPNVQQIAMQINACNYILAFNNNDSIALQSYIIVAVIPNKNSPANQKGLSGIYPVVEYGNWYYGQSKLLFFDEMDRLTNAKKRIVIDDNGELKELFFDGMIGCTFLAKKISLQERDQMLNNYYEWKQKKQ